MKQFAVNEESALTEESPVSELPFRESITKDEINQLRLGRYEGEIRLVRSDEACAWAVRDLRAAPVLGFDTETRPSFRKGQSFSPSLVQLAAEDVVFVFQLPKLTHLDILFEILADANTLKVGVATDHDVRQLRELQEFEPAGFRNLESMTDRLGIRNNGLRSLCAIVLGFRISKGEQRSNWSRDPLTGQQLTYAATDAWVSLQIYLRLQEVLRRGAES